MDIRTLTPDYAVSPQIDPEDCAALFEAGFGTIICNRPNAEIPASHHDDVMASAAAAAGLAFLSLPVTHQTMTLEIIAKQAEVVAQSDKPVLAYCASGTRSSIVWALGQAGEMPADEIIAAAAKAGYDLGGLKPQIEMLAAKKG
ncbi:TIGR01244 family protein [Cognatiyoonia koreensis]|uniref:TIGR01244 family protein n=1 Tax=Cognatiyoonia koreensis TaxID=364200 RepID=A0A1I0Q014_9RHOB|nr:TIGR01244 family sulfur transferase [Cognatiyoonia koreensis]SEW20080.1 TIGR01244 family protein [Cognatiyoonia koreensis]